MECSFPGSPPTIEGTLVLVKDFHFIDVCTVPTNKLELVIQHI